MELSKVRWALSSLGLWKPLMAFISPHILEWRWQRQLCKSLVGESKPLSAWVPEWSCRLWGIPFSHSSLILPQHCGGMFSSVQFSSVAQSCLTLCDPMNCSTPGLPVHHQLPESTQTHVHWVSDAIQPFHPLSSPSAPALKLSQHQGLFKRVSSSHQVAKVLEFQLQHQSFQWTPRTGLL